MERGPLVIPMGTHCVQSNVSLMTLTVAYDYTLISFAYYKRGNAALLANGEHLLINNLINGSDAYSVPYMKRLLMFKAPVSIRKPKQVAFGPAGTLVIQGSDNGLVYIHEFSSCKQFQKLTHGKPSIFIHYLLTIKGVFNQLVMD